MPRPSSFKRRLVGRPLASFAESHERLGKPTALAVLASDAISSTAYAGEEILRVLVPVVALAALEDLIPIAVVVCILLLVVISSYRQTIHAYPNGGGSYVVSKENLGITPALVAGASLLSDYVLTAAVSVSAGGTASSVSCGSGALPDEILQELHAEKLVDNVCFNLEVWSEALFAKISPGKHHFVGYDRWIRALEQAVTLWGAGHVYSAMVGGIELEPEHGMSGEDAVALALEGAEALCSRGIIPVYSLYWPVGGRDHPDYLDRLHQYFETLNLGCHAIRRKHGLHIWDGFMCHRCAAMQLECDVDRADAGS